MLGQNWCVLDGSDGSQDLVFFDDHGHVFDRLIVADQHLEQTALRANDFMWMRESSSFFSSSGVPALPKAGARNRRRPIYSSGEYWAVPHEWRPRPAQHGQPTDWPSKSLCRVVDAQDLVWCFVIQEIAAGRKQTHWMWFFPQLRGLGISRLAQYFGFSEPREAAEYWDDDVLGRSCAQLCGGVARPARQYQR